VEVTAFTGLDKVLPTKGNKNYQNRTNFINIVKKLKFTTSGNIMHVN